MSTACTKLAGILRSGLRARRRVALVLSTWTLLLFSLTCHGLDLGEPVIRSAVGEPLNVSIPLLSEAGTLAPEQCVARGVRIVSAADERPSTRHVRTRIESLDGLLVLRLTTTAPVTAPLMKVGIWAACVHQKSVRRAFALRLDVPPVNRASRIASSVSA